MISVIVPTLGTKPEQLRRLFESLDHQTYQDFEVIIVSQDNHDYITLALNDVTFKYNHITIDRKGLSLARNIGIQHANGSILTFSDDDCWYNKDSFELVSSYFERNSNTDVACFQIYDPLSQSYYKQYDQNEQKQVSMRKILKKSSIEIFIATRRIPAELIHFDENFGLGAVYPSGEENIFLFDLAKNGQTISYSPDIVVNHEKPEMQTRLNLRTFVGKGPMFKRMYNTPAAIILFVLFFAKKYNHLDKPLRYFTNGFAEIFKYKKEPNS
ncbi:glycosyltransferase family 2 protein [Rossellomorea aquimaris]|uniref:glycosyltransferase family 2 protein n=1 Tax=Rossellomorea aquimaris TaxID=189382 RepID=UPI001CD7024B|nr:glycosyltransferase family A protein [Rossellomorea aquimaris]MCA1060803.1 glycosyltransferase family 2 protein [Rossellomorea aquimaris]